MLGKRYFSTSVLFMVLCLVFVCSSSVAFAAGSLDLFQAQNDAKSLADVGLGNNAFQGNLQSISQGIVTMARIIATTFIALGGIMVAFNVESANKLLWNVMLGVGLALNFFIVIGSLYTTNGLVGTTEPFSYKFNLANGDTPWYNFVSDFTREYENFCKEGARVIVPIAAKLLLCLTAINGSLKVALGMVSGDKMKFLIETLVTTGFYLFLIMNWFNGDYTTASGDKMSSGMNLMGSLMEGFRSIGQQAGGFTDGSAPTNDIIGIACKMFLAGVGEGGGALKKLTSPIMSLATLIALFAMVVLLFLTGLEMVMARIEFVTLAMISIIMIPWGALKQTSFLFESALRAMFNLAIKVSVIAFIEAMSCTILTQYCEQFTQAAGNNNILGNFTLLLQVVFISIMLYFITKKIPELASSMISGNPSLGAASMVATAKNVSHAAVKGGAAVASGGAAVAAAGARGAVTAGGAAAGKAAAGGASAAGIAAAGIKGGAMGALNAMGGAAFSGTAGLAKRSLLGTKNQDGSRSGGLLSGAVNAALQGKDIGQAYVPKGGKQRRLFTKAKAENAKNAITSAANAVQHPAKTVANAVKNTQTVKSVQDAYRISQALNKGKDKK